MVETYNTINLVDLINNTISAYTRMKGIYGTGSLSIDVGILKINNHDYSIKISNGKWWIFNEYIEVACNGRWLTDVMDGVKHKVISELNNFIDDCNRKYDVRCSNLDAQWEINRNENENKRKALNYIYK